MIVMHGAPPARAQAPVHRPLSRPRPMRSRPAHVPASADAITSSARPGPGASTRPSAPVLHPPVARPAVARAHVNSPFPRNPLGLPFGRAGNSDITWQKKL